MVEAVAFYQMEFRMFGKDIVSQVLGKRGVALHGPELRATSKDSLGQCAQAGADFYDRASFADVGEFNRLAHNIAIDQEILSQLFVGQMLQLIEELSGSGGT